MHEFTVIGVELNSEKSIEQVMDKLLENLEGHDLKSSKTYNLSDNIPDYAYYGINNKIVKMEKKLIYEATEYSLCMECATYQKEADLYTLSVKLESQEVNNYSVFSLKKFTTIIFQRSFTSFYWLQDTHNEMVSAELYKEIHRVENKLRELIIKYMLKTEGIRWFENNILPKYKIKSAGFNRWFMRSGYRTFQSVSSELYNLQVSDLIGMLKESYPDVHHNKVKGHIKEIKNRLGENASIILKEESLELKTIWEEKDFDEILKPDFQEKWEEFSSLRNIIAHNKLVCSDLYKDINKKSEALNRIIDSGNEMIKQRISSTESKMHADFINSLTTEILVSEAGLNQYSEENIIIKMQESDEVINLFDSIAEYESEFLKFVEELDVNLENILNINFAEFEDKKALLNILIDLLSAYKFSRIDLYQSIVNESTVTLQEKLYSEITEEIKELQEVLKNKCNQFESTEIDEFKGGMKTLIPNIFGKHFITIELKGDITPDFGNVDNLDLAVTSEKEELAIGMISILHGNFEIDDDSGTGIPTQEQGIFYELEKVDNFILELLEDLKAIQYINDDLIQYF